jgi:FtsP/CotA-like multicopper oxidase with cupredoxin domain
MTAGGAGLLAALTAGQAVAQVTPQCPGDVDGDTVPDATIKNKANPDFDPNVRCVHLGAGDGFVQMADGRRMYMFGFSDMTGIPAEHVMMEGMLAASSPAPTITVDQGNELYVSLTNVGMELRPDLFDPHTVHWHGFPQAAVIFDGEPEGSVSINMGATFTYFYKVMEPGTYMYHCHVEATEHMQMGMLGNLYVRPAQNRLPDNTNLRGFVHRVGYKYAYNDGDGSTRYDVEYPLQLGGFDPDFHDASETAQPLPFAMMRDRYAFLNGRGYPDTVNPGPLAPLAENGFKVSQPLGSLIEANLGQTILLRISNLNVTRFHTIGTTGLPMRIVGHNARLLRGPSALAAVPGRDLYRNTNSITLGGGESLDVLIDTSGLERGTYFLFSKNLYDLSNNEQDFGGMMTEVVIR